MFIKVQYVCAMPTFVTEVLSFITFKKVFYSDKNG